MGIQDVSVTSGQNSSTNYAKASDYRKKTALTTDPVPKWTSVDLTQFIAQPFVDAQAYLLDAVDQTITVLEYIKELVDIYSKLILVPLDLISAVVETIRRLINELFHLINLDDAGMYALYIPFIGKGTDHYVNTFLDSLNDSKDLSRPRMRDNTYAAAVFMKYGRPTFDPDLAEAAEAIKSRFFQLKSNFVAERGIPTPQNLSAKVLMTPREKTLCSVVSN